MSNDDKKITSRSSSSGEIQAFLNDLKKLPSTGNRQGRLVFAIDATASRQATWDTACHIQAEMFSQTQDLGGLSAQLCYYQGFHEFYKTGWITQTKPLQQAMLGVQCLGGQTQIERLLKHIIQEAKTVKINAVIFIGDAVEEPADQLCQLAGQLGLLGIPLFMFHEGEDATVANVFRQMAKLSGGAYCPFNHASAKVLADLLGAVAVFASGGKRALLAHKSKAPHAVHLLENQLGAGKSQ